MSIIRVKKDKNNPYLIMNKTAIDDKRLSLKAKGLICYLLSKPDNWYINTKDVIKSSLDGRASVLSAINELVHFGYMYKHQFRSGNGFFHSYNYLVYEHPVNPLHKKQLLNPEVDFRLPDNPLPDNQLLLNNKTKRIIKDPLTTLYNKSNNVNVADKDPSLEYIKKYTITLLYELGIKEHKFLLDSFYIGDIFEYAEWMLTFISKIKNPCGFLVSAIKGDWLNLPAKHKFLFPDN